jgi:hypothetical protein
MHMSEYRTGDIIFENDPISITRELYLLIKKNYCDHFNHKTPRNVLPPNGIYLFFEKGESVDIDGITCDRIVRVGTHIKDGNFPGRIRQHYGNYGNHMGNKNGSVFRKHVGGAIMRLVNPTDPRLPGWLKQMGPSYQEVEGQVSDVLHEKFTFVCFPVSTKEDRLALESGLIALLAQYPLGKPSDDWLGKHAASPIIRCTGLWNTKETDKQPLTQQQLAIIGSLMASVSTKKNQETVHEQ